jgi:hypothetical protein
MLKEVGIWMNDFKDLTLSVTDIIISNRLPINFLKKNQGYMPEMISKVLKAWVLEKQDCELVIEISILTEGCHPLLIERWTLNYTQACMPLLNPNSHKDLFLRSIIQLATSIPILSTTNLNYTVSPLINLNWPKSYKSVQTYPKSGLKLYLDQRSISITCEVLEELPLPEIKQQDLGHRPRLKSIDQYEFTEKTSDNELNTSSDDPIICLNEFDMTKLKNCQQPKLITQNCNHEHESIGFTPLSHSICTEGCSSYCCSDFSIDNYSPYLNPFEENQISEDAAVSIYKLSCEKMSKIKLFTNIEFSDVRTLKASLIRMQNTLDLI